MRNKPLIDSLYQIGAVQFGNFTLKSGQTSSIYLNLRKIISYPQLLRTIANAMWEATRTCHYELVCGVPYTALPIATCISLEHNVPMIMRRKEKKDYGTKQSIEGVYEVGQRCLLIEDVITSGSSIIETANELAKNGIEVRDLVVLIDREQGGRAHLSQKYQVHTILSLSEILDALLHSKLLPPPERLLIEKHMATMIKKSV